MSLLSEVKSLLPTVTGLYIGSKPSTPDNIVCLYGTGGYPRDLSGTQVEELTFQVLVRNTSYAATEALCSTIDDLLHGHGTTKILMIQNQSSVLDLGRDSNDRCEMSMNYRCYYRK